VIRLVFHKFHELGSARQVLLWMTSQNIHFPYPSDGLTLTSFEWRPIRYRNIISILKNPFYAGVYAYGKSEKRTTIVDGRARKSYGHRKPMGTWEVFIQDHHEGYVTWAEYERNQALLAGNAYGRAGDTKSGRGGRALLAGLICCARCGRRLSVLYTGRYPRPIYRCEIRTASSCAAIWRTMRLIDSRRSLLSHRAGRDVHGQLCFIGGIERLQQLRELPVLNIETGKMVLLGEIEEPYSKDFVLAISIASSSSSSMRRYWPLPIS
jgi:hypothetical protein